MPAPSVTLFRRRCRVVVDNIEVVPLNDDPSKSLTVAFRVDKSLEPTPNTASIAIYNLNPDHLAQLAEKDEVQVLLEAGYEGSSSGIYIGQLRGAQSVPDDSGNVITTVASSDGAVPAKAAGKADIAIAKGTSTDLVLKQLVDAVGIPSGNLKDISTFIKAGAQARLFAGGSAFSGLVTRELTQVCRTLGLRWSIQDGKLQFLPLRQALQGEAIFLKSDTGLIGSPSVDPKGILTARMLMAPDVFPGRLVVVRSKTVNGQYRIEKTVHTGDTRGQDWFVDIEGKRY